MRKPIPLTWLELHDALQEQAAHREKPVAVMPRNEVEALSPSLPEDQREEALRSSTHLACSSTFRRRACEIGWFLILNSLSSASAR